MEIVRSRSDQPTTIAAFDQLVFYLDDVDAVTAATASLREAGLRAEPEPHAYWAANGAVVHHDPDGRDVVFAPWVFGRDPEPAERAVDASADQAADVSDAGQRIPSQPGLRIEEYDGPRSSLRFLFELAEDSPRQLDSYLDAGRVLVARSGGRIVGHLQLVPTGQADQAEIKNMAVLEEFRGQGIGRALVEVALRLLADAQVRDVLVGTAAADVGNLRFYQRCGFRLRSIEPDAFTPATGYPDPIRIDGIPLWDRVWLARDA
jgi:ribosomal protein S18 acetylase RimI-like enzyme